jgi:hypothetical protein
VTNTALPEPERDNLVESSLMVLLVVSVMLSVFFPFLRPIGGILLLLVAIACFPGLRRGQQIGIAALVGCGIALTAWGILRGFRPSFESLFSLNQEIVAMILAVSFVALIANLHEGAPPRLKGIPAVFRTAAISHVLGSVINLSAVSLIGDRLSRGAQLSTPNALLLSRTYSMGAYWSPFWAAAAAALAFAPGANPSVLISVGLVLAMCTLVLAVIGVVRRMGPEVKDYQGYGLSPTVIILPLVLMASVMIAHWIWPEVKTTNIVLMSSLAVTILVLLWRNPRHILGTLLQHSRKDLPKMRSESSLFAAAGVLAVGFSVFLQTTRVELPGLEFGVLFAWVAMIVVIVMSVFGVHQIITIGVLASVLAPLNPDPTLFAMACTAAWGTCAALSPVGGLNMFIMGRYGVSSIALSRGNALYALGVIVLALPILGFVGWYTGTSWW